MQNDKDEIIKWNDKDLLKLIPKPKTSLLSHTFDILLHSNSKSTHKYQSQLFHKQVLPLNDFRMKQIRSKYSWLFTSYPILKRGILEFIRPWCIFVVCSFVYLKNLKNLTRPSVGWRPLREDVFCHKFQDSLNGFCDCGKYTDRRLFHRILRMKDGNSYKM